MGRNPALGGGKTMSAPLVSVVIPFLNPVESFLAEAVASVLSQDYRPLELIFVDDGSNEDFSDRLAGWCSADGVPVQVLEHAGRINKGPSSSRNSAVAASTGKYVAFLDADDVWLPGKMSALCEILESDESIGLVFGSTKYWFDWQTSSQHSPRDFYARTGFRTTTVFEPPVFLTGTVRGTYMSPGPSNLFVRRTAFDACGGFEDGCHSVYEDQMFIAKLALAYRVCGVPRCWDLYRQHSDSMMTRAEDNDGLSIARHDYLAWLTNYCEERGVQHRRLAEAIAKERWLEQPFSVSSRGRSFRMRRWFKKWLLRFEERVLPARIRWRYWLKQG